MTSLYANITKQVAAIIEGGTYSKPIKVCREYIASVEAKRLPTDAPYIVSITPMGLSGRPGDRQGLQEADYSIGVEFLAQLRNTNNVEKIDEFFTIIEEIQDGLASNPFLAEGYLVFPYANDTAFSQQAATEQVTFKNLTTLTYRVTRGQ